MVGYVLDNDAYIATDYVDAAYVGTDNDLLYVEDGYVGVIVQASASLTNNSFINAVPNKITPAVAGVDAVAAVSSTPNRIMPFSATLGGDGAASISASAVVRPGADLVASSSVSVVAAKITGITKNIIQAGDETTWETALTWANPRQDVWAKRVQILANAFKPSSGSYTVNSTLSADGDRTARIDIVVEGTGSLSAIGGSSLVGTSSVNSNATLNADALKNPVGVANLNSSATLSSNAIYVVNGRSSLQGNATVSTLGTRIKQFSSTVNSNAAIGTEYIRFRNNDATLSSNSSVTALAGTIGRGTVLKAGISSLSSDGLRGRGFVDYTITANATIDKALAGRLVDFAKELVVESSASVSGSLYKLIIDPYRVYTIVDEGRSLQIVEESRIKTLKSENRLNTLQAETRGYPVRSETRNVEVENSILVKVFDPLDRRE